MVLETGTVLEGAGIALTSLELAAGKNSDVVESYDADDRGGTNVQQGTNDWSLSDLTINGNAASQTATGSARDLVNGITAYGWHWQLLNLLIENVLGHGMRQFLLSPDRPPRPAPR